jgi:predicted N-acetyltransferase YhbS
MKTHTLLLHAQLALETASEKTMDYLRAQYAQPHLMLTALEVESQFRNRGVGRSLVRSALQQLEHAQLDSAFVYTDKLRFFGRLGFKPVRASTVPQNIAPHPPRRGHAQWLVTRRRAHPCELQGVKPTLQIQPERPTP